tara:strand:+ start:1251 stop:1424 length:174 start_codon:yes stop_codon:yes gene_type:complete
MSFQFIPTKIKNIKYNNASKNWTYLINNKSSRYQEEEYNKIYDQREGDKMNNVGKPL